jgi:exodeoxyribonuclease V alpha subunit
MILSSSPQQLRSLFRSVFGADVATATIHKSQSSEYPAEVIPVMTQHYTMLQRNLLYTGVTRGKDLVVLVGKKKAVAIAVCNTSSRRRWSKLGEWLQR